MDGINRFGLSKVVSEPANPELEAAQAIVPQAPSETSGESYFNSLDSMERYQPADVQVMDFGSLISARVDTTQLRWNAISTLMDQIQKTPPDPQAILSTLQSLDPEDRKFVLEQLSSQGRSPNSDLDKLVHAMYAGESSDTQQIGDFLASLAQDVHHDPSERDLFGQIYNDCRYNEQANPNSCKAGDTALFFLKSVSADSGPAMVDVLKSLSPDTLQHLQSSLEASESKTTETLELRHQLDYASYLSSGLNESDAAKNADEDLNKRLYAIDATSSNYGEYLDKFPEWGMNVLVHFITNPFLFSGSIFGNMIQTMEQNCPEQLGDLMSKFSDVIAGNTDGSFLKGSPADIAETVRSILNVLQNSQSKGTGENADDTIRQLVSSLQPDAAQTLGKLPPNLLLQMASIIQNGDDRVLSSDAENAIGQALYMAEH